MPRNGSLFMLFSALAVCLHTLKLHICMLWLTMVLRKPAIARRIIAIDLLRRSDQMQGHRRRAQSTPASRFRFRHSLVRDLQPNQARFRSKTHGLVAATMQGGEHTHERVKSKTPAASLLTAANLEGSYLRSEQSGINEIYKLDTTAKRSVTDSELPSVPRKVSTTGSSAIAQNFHEDHAQAGSKESPIFISTCAPPTPLVSPTEEARCEYTCEKTPEQGETRRTMTGQLQPHNDFWHTPPLSDIGSASSDTTSAEKRHWPSCTKSSTTVDNQADVTEGAKENSCVDPCPMLTDAESRARKRWSAFSMDSISTAIRKSSTANLRARTKIDGGLLEFKAKMAEPKEPLPTSKHRRILSLNLPIRPCSSQLDRTPHTPSRPTSFITPASRTVHDAVDAATQTEAELQYKQRHIFVGTVSLHAFLEVLETTTLNTTTKLAVMKGFTALASKEQLRARRDSLDPEDWNLVTRITADITDFDYLVLARVQLGSISLQQFVDAIPFNVFEEVPVTTVVEAFKVASHLDAIESRNTSSKARVFRDLLLSRSNPVD